MQALTRLALAATLALGGSAVLTAANTAQAATPAPSAAAAVASQTIEAVVIKKLRCVIRILPRDWQRASIQRVVFAKAQFCSFAISVVGETSCAIDPAM